MLLISTLFSHSRRRSQCSRSLRQSYSVTHSLPSAIDIASLKAHVGFVGNELADAVAKWIYHNSPPHPNLVPPPPKGCIAISKIPITQKISKKLLRRITPRHLPTSLHSTSSFSWYVHSNRLDNLPFLWVSATLLIDGYPSHQDMSSYRCFHCRTVHPMDPLSMISQCPSTWLLQELFIRAWPSSRWPTLLRWWSSAHPGERRYFIRTLILASVHSAVFTSLSPAPDHWAQLLSSRRSAITAAVTACRDWLQSNTPPAMPSQPKSINYFRTPNWVYSTSYMAESHKRPRHHAYSPPDPIPSQVKKRKVSSPSVRT